MRQLRIVENSGVYRVEIMRHFLLFTWWDFVHRGYNEIYETNDFQEAVALVDAMHKNDAKLHGTWTVVG